MSSTINHHKLQRRNSKFRMSFKSKKARQVMVDTTCHELASEGERLCRDGRWEEGIQQLEAATRTGTSDVKILSALYSQLGNAYFYVENYSKSLEYHKQDLTLARSMGDRLGEAKACGNIGSALKALGQYDESIACCRMQLDLARGMSDKVLESRALYNLGNVFHARGKSATVGGDTSSGDTTTLDSFVRESLEQAARHYELNLKIVKDLGDHQAQGRTVGNLGNTHYLLGNYKKAIKYHEERLSIAELLGDKVAARRAYSNLGNAQVFLGKYSAAAQYYLNALEVSKEVGDVAFEAQSCYSLGNTYTLMENHQKAVDYHTRHLHYAMQLGDQVGESRAYWSLGNAYTAMRDHVQARHFAHKHLALSVELGDAEGQKTARRNIEDLSTVLNLSHRFECPSPRLSTGSHDWSNVRRKVGKKLSNLSIASSTCSTGSAVLSKHFRHDSRCGSTGTVSPTSSLSSSQEDSLGAAGHTVEDVTLDDGFFDMVTKCQAHRLDDQRTSAPATNQLEPGHRGDVDEDLFDMLWSLQGCRIEDQRSVMSEPPHIMTEARQASGQSQEELFDMILSVQSARIDEQRSADPTLPSSRAAVRKSTMPSEDFFNLIQHLQSTRIEDQRSPLPLLAN